MSPHNVQNFVAQGEGSQPQCQGWGLDSFDNPGNLACQKHLPQTPQQQQIYIQGYCQSKQMPHQYSDSSCVQPSPRYADGNPGSRTYYPSPAMGTNAIEPIFGQQMPFIHHQLDVQHETQELSIQPQARKGQHSYANSLPGQQNHHHALPPAGPKPHTSELLFALQLDSQLSQPSSSPSPFSDEVNPDNPEDCHGSRDNRSEFSDMRLPSAFANSGITNDAAKASVKRKHSDPGQDQGISDTNDNDEVCGVPSVDEMKAARGGKRRNMGACTHCQKAKLKCQFQEDKKSCERCELRGRTCIVESRNPKMLTNRRDYLLAQIKQKDAVIESLLKQLYDPYNSTPVSLTSYRMGTSPSDCNNMDPLEWLSRVVSKIDSTDVTGGQSALRESATGRDSKSDTQEGNIRALGSASSPENDTVCREQDLFPINKVSPLLNLHTPISMIAELSLSNADGENAPDLSNSADDDVGVANKGYFRPGPATDLDARMTMIEQHSLPEIILWGLVTADDVDRLFDIFYEHINPFVPLLDPVLHTPELTFARCPSLYNAICAVSSRYDVYKSEYYPVAMRYAEHSAAGALINGWKSVELCQAFILMSMYAVPTKRWEDNRIWLYTGLAIRIATDLNLHQISITQPQNEKQEREMLNRMRVWLICCNLDLSTATQFGRPPTIKEDYIVRDAKEWYRASKYNSIHDMRWCAHLALLQIDAGFHDQVLKNILGSADQKALCSTIMDHDVRLTSYHEEWLSLFTKHSDANDSDFTFQCDLLGFLVGHSRLMMHTFTFNHISQRGIEPGDIVYITKILEASKFVIEKMSRELAPTRYMRHAPDEYFMVVAFASAFLIKLFRSEISGFFSKEQESEMLDLIEYLIHALSSQNVAVDERHAPKIYSRFLADLVSRHRSSRAWEEHRPERSESLVPPRYTAELTPLIFFPMFNGREGDQEDYNLDFADQTGAALTSAVDFGTDFFWDSSASSATNYT